MTVHDDVEVTPDAERKSGPSRLLIGLLAVALVLSGILIGVLVSPNDTISTTPAPDSVEVGFAQDMSVHHNQAIESVGSTFQNAASSGPLVLAIAACMLAGLVSFASPCVVPLVPGYLSYLAGIAGADAPPIGAASTSGAPSKLASRWRVAGRGFVRRRLHHCLRPRHRLDLRGHRHPAHQRTGAPTGRRCHHDHHGLDVHRVHSCISTRYSIRAATHLVSCWSAAARWRVRARLDAVPWPHPRRCAVRCCRH